MATITVRNIPDEVVEMIKSRARRNKRSMEQEVRTILTEVATDRVRAMKRIELLRRKQKHPVPREEIDEWLKRARYKEDT